MVSSPCSCWLRRPRRRAGEPSWSWWLSLPRRGLADRRLRALHLRCLRLRGLHGDEARLHDFERPGAPVDGAADEQTGAGQEEGEGRQNHLGSRHSCRSLVRDAVWPLVRGNFRPRLDAAILALVSSLCLRPMPAALIRARASRVVGCPIFTRRIFSTDSAEWRLPVPRTRNFSRVSCDTTRPWWA